ncbi:hypothetical protein PL326_01090 [Clostridium perfringens D]|nr:hypothetical protein [Clostridium perfringens]WEV13326.1 hypothetical protein PL326_01090 [Clostridium perfringens D]
MRYSVEGVCQKFKSGEELEFLFFWGHTKNKNGKITRLVLANGTFLISQLMEFFITVQRSI